MRTSHERFSEILFTHRDRLVVEIEQRYLALTRESGTPASYKRDLEELLGFLELAAGARTPELFADGVGWMESAAAPRPARGRDLVLAVRAVREALLEVLPIEELPIFSEYARAAFAQLSRLAWRGVDAPRMPSRPDARADVAA